MSDINAETMDLGASARTGAPTGRPEASVGDMVALLKPRVMSLVVFTGFVGLYLAPGTLHPLLGAIAVLAIAVGAGASGAINMWYDRDIDAVMRRTSARPIPRGRVSPEDALAFGITLSVFSVMVMGLALNWLAAALLAGTIAFYVFIYTMWLKRRTPQNIVIGGAAGALPPVVGWAAASGDVGWMPIVLFAIIFMWTPPHFWALALYRDVDYSAAGVPMLPVVAGARHTRAMVLLYSVLLVPLTLVPVALGEAGWLYGVGAAVSGLAMLACAWRVWRPGGESADRAMFSYSILYLLLIFTLLVVDRVVAV